MVSLSHTGGIGNKRVGHFLKPTTDSFEVSSFKLPLLSPKSKWPLDLVFSGWQNPFEMWDRWVDEMFLRYHSIWKKAGIVEAVLSSKYKFNKNAELILGIAERWCADTNTFAFPWGEVSITLEDMMILGGFSILGCPVLLPLEGAELVAIETSLKKGLTRLENVKRCTHIRWQNSFMGHARQHEHEAFLLSWLSRFVFPVDEITMIGKHILPITIYLARGIRIALAPAVLASIYRDLSILKATMTSSTKLETEEDEGNTLALALWAPFQLVQLWAWERLVKFRPEPSSLRPGEPRVARWHNLQRLDIGNVRPILNSCSKDFLWRPYCLEIENLLLKRFYTEKEERVRIGQYSDEELESFARCLRVGVLVGIDCEETYQPHRVAMQFGYDQDLPGLVSSSDSSTEAAWINYSRPLNNETLYLPSRLSEPNMSIRYLDWWRNSVLVPVDSVRILRGLRSLRSRRMYFPNPEQAIMPNTDSEALTEENIQVPSVSQQDSNKQKISTEEEDLNCPNVQPGFSPEIREVIDLNRVPDSLPECQSSRLDSFAKHQTFDLNLPPNSPPES